jgi:hypothetical protein
MKTISKTPATDAVKRLHLFLTDDPEEMTHEEIRALLIAGGVDVDEDLRQIRLMAEEACARLQ